MGKTQKKNSKGRLDRYYYLAKEKGYRARSSFKIIQINEKYGHFLEKSKVVIDLCAAPGSWCQVASNLCPVNSLIIGVDIVPIKPLPNCITFQSDITTDDCRSRLRGHMKTWKADTVLHDGAPNVGLGWVQDAFTQSQLTLQALKLAAENLAPGGTFVTKVFRSKDYNNLMWVFQQLFEKVEATKPPASRNVSAEIFVVCRKFKAPKKLDPRLLDPKEVFEELPDGPKNNESKIFNPEKKVRKRQGYDEDDYLLFHSMPIMEFIKHEDPITVLGDMSEFTIDKEDTDWKILKKLPACSTEFLECIKDLRVLGKKDFKLILKFRKKARDLLGLDVEEEKPEVEVEPLTEEEQITKELEKLTERKQQKLKRERKNKKELKQRENQRLQMNMLTDMNIGLEAAQIGSDTLFNLKSAEKSGKLSDLIKGKRQMVFNDTESQNDIYVEQDEELDSADELEAQLDDMYSSYQERQIERNAKLKAKLARGDENEEAWDGLKSDEENNNDSGDNYEEDDQEENDSDLDDDEHIKLITDVKNEGKLSKRAKVFFSDGIFDLGEINDETESINNSSEKHKVSSAVGNSRISKASETNIANDSDSEMDENDSDSNFEIVSTKTQQDYESDSDSDSESNSKKNLDHNQRIELATVEAMTLAHQVALGQINKKDLIEEGFNRYSFRDVDGLPEWFLDDEKRHSKIVKPITKEAALAIKQKQRELNARPIKKILEAKGRKKLRALKRLEKIKKKSDLINDDNDKSERDKAEEISKLMRKITKKQKQKPKVTVVVANGSNKGLSGRPKGVKGKYKMVDGSLKNEQRALRRIAKRNRK